MDTTPISAVPDGSVAVPLTSLIQVHSPDHLPCPACSYGVLHTILDDLDFCEDCAHYHVESDCPTSRLM